MLAEPIKSMSKKLLSDEYVKLFNKCEIDSDKIDELNIIVKKIIEYRKTYEKVKIIPWWLVGILHYERLSFDFTKHLHNGDSLLNRTVNSPKNRPEKGKPPYSWFDSAKDAISLKIKFIPKDRKWTISDVLYFLESYEENFKTRIHKRMYSSSLWSNTNIRTDNTDKIGAAAILKALLKNKIIELSEDRSTK